MASTSRPTKEKSTKMYPNNGYILFRNEFIKDNKFTDFNVMNTESSKAWKTLSVDEKKKYSDRAIEATHEKKKGTNTASLTSRCSMNKFSKLVAYVNSDKTLKAKVQQLGFGELLHIKSQKFPREMLVRIMRAYDPPTNQFRIRGKTREIDGKDVAQLLGVPHKGDEVKMNVSDTDPFLQQLRKEYGKMKYDDVLNVITSGESGDKFEMLFMMHMLGTFLAPTSSTTPAEKLLKVLTSTINGFARFDWATYIAKDIQKELGDYVNAIRGNNNCNSYVGGCIYMLLLFFGEQFSLGKPVQHVGKSPVEFWTKEKVMEMIDIERKSNMGLLYDKKAENRKTWLSPKRGVNWVFD